MRLLLLRNPSRSSLCFHTLTSRSLAVITSTHTHWTFRKAHTHPHSTTSHTASQPLLYTNNHLESFIPRVLTLSRYWHTSPRQRPGGEASFYPLVDHSLLKLSHNQKMYLTLLSTL